MAGNRKVGLLQHSARCFYYEELGFAIDSFRIADLWCLLQSIILAVIVTLGIESERRMVHLP